jgi:sulfofructosephosphate aldolase
MSLPEILAPLARPSGGFAMLALDQREGLRSMLGGGGTAKVPDDALRAFKVAAAEALTPSASAVLLDVDYGLEPVRQARAIAPGCGLIVAADRLTQEPDEPVEWTEVDEAVLANDGIASIADAYKLLVIWRRGEEHERARVVRRFVEAAHERQRAAIVEGIVRGADGALPADRHADTVVEAAAELASFGADLYKAEVPTLGTAADEAIRAAAERLTNAIPCPWVVLSNGTPADRFDRAMLAACRGGADGFLAGRAIWTASIAAPDTPGHLRTVAAPRLAALGAAVDSAIAARRTM